MIKPSCVVWSLDVVARGVAWRERMWEQKKDEGKEEGDVGVKMLR